MTGAEPARPTSAALAPPPTAPVPAVGVDPGTAIAQGEHYRIVCHFLNRAVADTALTISETAWSIAADLLGLPAMSRAQLLEIHLYRTMEDFDFARAAVGSPAGDPDVPMLSQAEQLRAHITVQPILSQAALGLIGLPSMAKQGIAYHAVRLATAAASANFRFLPSWYTAGLAQWAGVRTAQRLGFMRDPADDPIWSTYMLDLQRWQGVRRWTPSGDVQRVVYAEAALRADDYRPMPLASSVLVADLPDVFQARYYGLAWAMFEVLMSPRHAAATRELLSAMRALDPGGGGRARVLAASAARAKATYGNELPVIDREMEEWIAALAPRWDEPYRSLDTSGPEWRQIAFPHLWRNGSNAIAWRQDRVTADEFTVSGKLRVFPNAAHQMNVLLGLADESFVQIGFVANQGVWVYRYDASKSTWTEVGHSLTPAFQVGAVLRFTISHHDRVTTVEADGQPVINFELDQTFDGRWGLGVYQGTAGAWSDVSARAGPPPATGP